VKTIAGEYEVVGVDFALKHKKRFFFMYDVCHLNWLENIKGTNELRCLFSFLFRVFFLLLLKIRCKPIIWTVHNKVAHNQAVGKKYSIILMHLLVKWSTRIHVLCNETVREFPLLQANMNKVVMIPHGDYIDNFGEENVNVYQKFGIPKDKNIILFTGKIGPYKNLELLILAFVQSKLAENKFVLLLCGSCSSKLYQDKLISLVDNSGPNIFYDFEFIPNECMGDYLNQSSILIAPYNRESTLNSGTLWMAFSYKKTIISPLLGCMKDVKGIDEIAYTYDYKNSEEHLFSLVQILNTMGEDVQRNSSILKEKGNRAFEIMGLQTWESHKSQWINLYVF